jgi:hypothetical protein
VEALNTNWRKPQLGTGHPAHRTPETPFTSDVRQLENWSPHGKQVLFVSVPFHNYAKSQIAKACLQYGLMLDSHLAKTDDGAGSPIAGSQLLFAIAGVESSFGVNCRPRLEPGYSYGGKYASTHPMPDLLSEFGLDAAYSYGPWQVLLCNAYGYKPTELAMDLEKACIATIGHIRRFCLEARKCEMLRDIADTYNSGNPRDAHIPEKYIAAVAHNYFSEVIAEALSKRANTK